MARDDFNSKTKDILAKRVGFLCSNPICRKHTIGPNSNPDKATIIGKAAHITAASLNGPRHDSTLLQLQRKSISNGIWLCSNCADLIDKDENFYSVDLLIRWRNLAENEMRLKINGVNEVIEEKIKPKLDIDIIWQLGMRNPNGQSPQNKYEYNEEDNSYSLITNPPIMFWRISWDFKLVIYNNSTVPIFNLKIQEIDDVKFDYLAIPDKKNNLPPLQNIDLEAKYCQQIESSYLEANELMSQKIPAHLEGLRLKFSYTDEMDNFYTDIFEIQNSEFKKIFKRINSD
jgi:hypothetical protein